MKRIAQYFLIAAMLVYLLWRGIIPAMNNIDTDFSNYYVSSRLFLEGKDLSRLYDDNWFQQQISGYGITQLGKFSPFPPVTVFIMTPLASLDPLNALRAWSLFNLLLSLVCIILLTKIVKKPWAWASIVFLGSGIALINNFRFGQFYLVLTFLIIAGYFLWKRGFPVSAGVLFGAGTAFKYFPLVFLLFFLAKKEWKVVIACLVTVATIYGIGLLILGIDIFQQFFSIVFLDHLEGNMQDPFTATFQSWNSLFRRLFVYDPLLNQSPLIPWQEGYALGTYFIIGLISAVAVWSFVRVRGLRDGLSSPMQFALIAITALLVLPASATYHYLLLIVPAVMLLNNNSKKWDVYQKIIAAMYFVIGFMPYRFFRSFDSQGILTLAAYPRLWCLTVLFIVTVLHLNRLVRQQASQLLSLSAS